MAEYPSQDYLKALQLLQQEDQIFKSLQKVSDVGRDITKNENIARANAKYFAAQYADQQNIEVYRQRQIDQSRALQNVEPPPYVIGATYKDEGSSTMDTNTETFREFVSFHAEMERERGESKPKVDFRYRVAQLLLLGLVLQLIVEILK